MHDQSPEPRRRRNEGSVSRRADGRWQYRFRDVTGKRVYGYAASEADATRELGRAITKRDEGIPALDRRMTLGHWLDHWLATLPPGRLRPRSRKRYAYVASVWKGDHAARTKLAELTPTHVSAAMARQVAAGASLATVATNLRILRIALKAAVLDGRAGRNVALLVDTPKVEPRRISPPAGDDLARLRAAIAGDRLEGIWSLALGAGLRHGEILALRWHDVDLPLCNGVMVQGTLEEGSDRVGPTKSRHGARHIPVAPWVADALRRHYLRERGIIPAPGAFLFHTTSGRPYDASNVRRFWYALCDRAGTRRYRIHDLRHAFATALLAGTKNHLAASRYIGHATIAETFDTYGHPGFDELALPEPGR